MFEYKKKEEKRRKKFSATCVRGKELTTNFVKKKIVRFHFLSFVNISSQTRTRSKKIYTKL